MSQAENKPAVPTGFWIVAVLSTVWNAFGAYDYVMTRLRDLAYLDGASGGKGAAMLQWLDGLPLLVQICWPLGVWASLAGSVLLLLRSRHAVTVFLVSLVAAVISMGTERFLGIPAEFASTAMTVMNVVVVVVIVALWRYAVSAKARGLLR